jgi:hypothetical protein
MPIPSLDSHGFLPVGIYTASLDEIRARFGSFQGSDRRPRLFERLAELVDAMRRSSLFEFLLIDGSFVTAKAAPNDIDLVAVLRPGHDFERELSVSEYALISRRILTRRFHFDVVIVETESALYNYYVEFFSRVREAQGLRKGLLQVDL